MSHFVGKFDKISLFELEKPTKGFPYDMNSFANISLEMTTGIKERYPNLWFPIIIEKKR